MPRPPLAAPSGPWLERWSAAIAAAAGLPEDIAALYYDRRALEELMSQGNYQYQSDFARKYVAEGKAEAILRVLDARRFAVSDAQRARVLACSDAALLDRWLDRAVTAASADEALAD